MARMSRIIHDLVGWAKDVRTLGPPYVSNG